MADCTNCENEVDKDGITTGDCPVTSPSTCEECWVADMLSKAKDEAERKWDEGVSGYNAIIKPAFIAGAEFQAHLSGNTSGNDLTEARVEGRKRYGDMSSFSFIGQLSYAAFLDGAEFQEVVSKKP